MSKTPASASRPNKPLSKRDQLRLAEARKERHRKVALIATSVVLALALIISGFFVIKHHKDTNRHQSPAIDKKQILSSALVSLDSSYFNRVGKGDARYASSPSKESVSPSGEKPKITYIGAEFCPYCAMERPSLVAALSRFGKFSGLKDVTSSPNEGKLSDIPTVSFRDASYESEYIDFEGYETQDRFGNNLEPLPVETEQLFQKNSDDGGIPFTYWGDKTTEIPADASFLAGENKDSLVQDLHNPKTPESKAIIGGANLLSAQICEKTRGNPENVCNSPGVTSAAKLIGK